MKKYIKPVALNIFENKGLIPLVAGGASLAKAFAVGVSAGLMMGGRRDIYTPAKYSLQGTTQGNGLTGGLPPVRFSM